VLAIFAATGVLAQAETNPPQAPSAQQPSAQDSSKQGPGDSEGARRIRVGGNVAAANLVHQVVPVYPEIAKAAHISGTVVMHCIIAKDGSVEELQYVSGPPLLLKSAMDAVRQWKYKPTLLNGAPVEVDTTVAVVFTLGGSKEAEPAQQQDAPAHRPDIMMSTLQPLHLISKPLPIYPEEAKAKHIEGIVLLRARISADGSVKELEFDSGPPELMDAAMDAVRKWKYSPMVVNGETVEAQGRVAILFSLTKNNYKLMATSFDPVAAEVIASTEDVPPPKHPAAARAGLTPIPDTLDGIQKQTQEVFDAWRAGDQKKYQELLDGFAVEDPEDWLSSTFGAEQSAILLPQYEVSLEKFKQHMGRIAGYWEKSTTSALRVEASVTPNPPTEAGQADGPPAPLQPLTIENFRFYVTTGQVDPGDWVFSFVYVDGAFRIVGGTHTFWNEEWRRERDGTPGMRVFTTTAKATPPAPADRSQEPFLYEQVRGKMRYENDGTGSREVTARMRVQTPAGLAKAGQLIFDYNAANEKIEMRSVKVTKPDGSVITAGPSAVQDLSAPVAREAPMYTDARQMHVTVPGVAVGDIIEYDVVITTFEPLLPGQFWQTWNFISDAISLDEQVDLDVPRERALKIKAAPGIDSSIREEGNRRIYHWGTSTLEYADKASLMKNFKFDVKTMLQGVSSPPGRTVMFSTFQSWGEIGTWYASLERDRRAPTAEIRAKADEIVAGQTSDVDKVRALYEWVSRNVRYVSLSFGVGRYQPHAAAEVLQNRYGDCKDKATLLEALLEAEGFHGDPVLINSKGGIDPDVPTPLQFDHAFTLASVGGHDYWLDPTLGVGPFGYLLPQLRGESALAAIGKGKFDLRRTPEKLPFAAVYKLDVQGSMDSGRNMDMKMGLDTRGDLEVLLRTGFMQLSPGQLTTVMQQMQRGAAAAPGASGSNITFSDLKGSDPSDIRNPFHVEIRLKGNAPDTKKDLGDAKPKTPEQSKEQLRSMLSYLLPKLDAPADGKAKPQAARPEGERDFSLNFVFTSPEIKKPMLDKPIHVDISKDFAEFKADIARDGETARGSLLLNLYAREVPADKTDDYAAFVEAVSDSFASFSPKSDASTARSTASDSASTNASSAQPEAQEMYAAGIKAFNNRDFKTARQQYEGAVEKDPRFGSAWNSLGRTYMNLGLLDKATQAFQKAIEISPNERFAYNNLGLVLQRQGKYDEATRAYQKQIEVNSKDIYAHGNLGRLYVETGKYDLAVKELETATSLSNTGENQASLGRAYLELDQPEKARQAFDRAVELSPTPATFNSVAYSMALKKLDLERAQNYAESAISSTSALLRNVSIDNPSMREVHYAAPLAAYWDTLGWIKFQEGDFQQAEKYVMSAWMLVEFSEVADHLAQIYEKEGRTADAVHQYELALATSFPMPETRPRLIALLGTDRDIDALVSKAGGELPARRTAKFANRNKVEGEAEFWVLFVSDEKPPEVRFISGNEKLRRFVDIIPTAKFPPMFPDSTETRLLRRGILACTQQDSECTFELMPAESVHSVE